jgi:hypothetical protein
MGRGITDEAERRGGAEVMANDGVHRWRVGSGGQRCPRGDPLEQQSKSKIISLLCYYPKNNSTEYKL